MSRNQEGNSTKEAPRLTIPNLQLQLMREMRRMLRAELEQVHKRLDRIEIAHLKQPQNTPNVCKRERVQFRGVRDKDEKYYGAGFDKEDNQDLVVGNRRYERRFTRVRNQEDNNLVALR